MLLKMLCSLSYLLLVAVDYVGYEVVVVYMYLHVLLRWLLCMPFYLRIVCFPFLQLLCALQLCGASLDDYLHLLVPPIVKVFETPSNHIDVRR